MFRFFQRHSPLPTIFYLIVLAFLITNTGLPVLGYKIPLIFLAGLQFLVVIQWLSRSRLLNGILGFFFFSYTVQLLVQLTPKLFRPWEVGDDPLLATLFYVLMLLSSIFMSVWMMGQSTAGLPFLKDITGATNNSEDYLELKDPIIVPEVTPIKLDDETSSPKS